MRSQNPETKGEFENRRPNTLRGRGLTNARILHATPDADHTQDLPDTSTLGGHTQTIRTVSGAEIPGEDRHDHQPIHSSAHESDTPTLHTCVDGAISSVARNIAWALRRAGYDLIEANESAVRAIEPMPKVAITSWAIRARSVRIRGRRRGTTPNVGKPKATLRSITVRLNQQPANRVEIRAVSDASAALSTVDAALYSLEVDYPQSNESPRR